MKRPRTFRRKGLPIRRRLPDARLLDDVVAPRVLAAMRTASAQLALRGIRHALVGALAVGAYGYPRATDVVDFLVGEEAFEHHAGGIVTIVPGVPVAVQNISVDLLSITAGEEHLNDVLDGPIITMGVPIVSVEDLIFLKLKSPRRKDAADVVELLKRGVNPDLLT